MAKIERKTRVISIDPGKLHTWFTCWEGKRLLTSGKLPVPDKISGVVDPNFRLKLIEWLASLGLHAGDHLVVERYVHRPGIGGTVSEIMQAIIWTIVAVGNECSLRVFLYSSTEHKNSFGKHHTNLYPLAIIKDLGEKHGSWRPKLKRKDACQHVMDSATLGCYHILKRNREI